MCQIRFIRQARPRRSRPPRPHRTAPRPANLRQGTPLAERTAPVQARPDRAPSGLSLPHRHIQLTSAGTAPADLAAPHHHVQAPTWAGADRASVEVAAPRRRVRLHPGPHRQVQPTSARGTTRADLAGPRRTVQARLDRAAADRADPGPANLAGMRCAACGPRSRGPQRGKLHPPGRPIWRALRRPGRPRGHGPHQLVAGLLWRDSCEGSQEGVMAGARSG